MLNLIVRLGCMYQAANYMHKTRLYYRVMARQGWGIHFHLDVK